MAKTPSYVSADEAMALVRSGDTVAAGLATGEPPALLEALGRRTDLTSLTLYGAIFTRPYPILTRPGVRVMSGFFGPIERMARAAGADIEYMHADFIGLEQLALMLKPRVVLAATTVPDEEGYVSFGVHAGATYKAFVEAARDPARVAIAACNPHMPWLDGFDDLGGNRIHASDLDALALDDSELFALPAAHPSDAERAITRNAEALIEEGSCLQFGIGAVPDEIARLLADGPKRDFSIHSEMISDGVMALHESGSVANRKELYDGFTVATFALGSPNLYRWLDRNPAVRMAPVSAVNDVALIRRLSKFVSVNSALAIDLRGQVVADYIGGHQYSGIGGHEMFVMAATECANGKSLVCMPSTATVNGRRVSKIVPAIGVDATVTTPRQHVQYVVTEHGAADIFALGDRSRPAALIELAAPEFRDRLRAEAKKLI
jgi:acyl-CoA hydrolase